MLTKLFSSDLKVLITYVTSTNVYLSDNLEKDYCSIKRL